MENYDRMIVFTSNEQIEKTFFWKLVIKNIAKMSLYMTSEVYHCRHLRGANFKSTHTNYIC